MSAAIEQRNQEATCYVGNLDERVSEELLWELMVQCGPVVNVHMPKDKVTGKHLGYGFVEFRSEEDAEYAMRVMNMIKLHGKLIKLNKASADKKQTDIGANLFIGNLDPDVDEKLLHDTFSAFGAILQPPKVMRDPDTGMSKGYGFVSLDSFEAADMATECMNGQFLCNRSIVVQYAYKKDTQGERHGSQAERLLAASQPQRFKRHTIFSAGVGDVPVVNPAISISSMQTQIQQQQQQMQMQMQMQMTAYGQQMAMAGMGYGQLPLQMQMQMAGMPPTPSPLPGYMQPGMMPAPPMGGMMAPPPPPPPVSAYGYQQDMSFPPPPPPAPGPPPPMGSNFPPPPPPPPM